MLALPPAIPAAAPAAYTCGAPATTVLLWPHGHKAIRSVHFPAARTPNIQIYRYDPRFAGGNFLVYADAKGNRRTAPGYCGKTAHQVSGAIASPQTLTGKRAISCIVTASQAYELTRQAHGIKILGRMAARTLFVATVTRAGKAKITFDSSVCQVVAGPAR
jgi:hypothetical protein